MRAWGAAMLRPYEEKPKSTGKSACATKSEDGFLIRKRRGSPVGMTGGCCDRADKGRSSAAPLRR